MIEGVGPTISSGVAFRDHVLSGWYHDNDKGEMFKGFSIQKEDVVLDAGCGPGGRTAFCARHASRVIFMDIDRAKVAAAEHALTGIEGCVLEPLVSDGNPIPLPDATCTKVCCIEVLEHVDDAARFLAELTRVGRHGARYLITVPDPLNEKVQWAWSPNGRYFQKPNHIRIIERDEFERLVVEAGLVVEERHYEGFFMALWWVLVNIASHQTQAAVGQALDAGRFGPPADPLLDSWARTWDLMLDAPEGARLKAALDQAMPKSQIIIARKP